MPFNPKDKFSTTFAYPAEGKWRTGVEASFMANQYVTDRDIMYSPEIVYVSHRVPNFWFWAAMVEKQLTFGSIILNVENLFDARQSKFEELVSGSPLVPDFKPVWASVEGRVINLSVRISLGRGSER
jgi:iron complex outermembrane receptor protein/outer membrane receptor for ferrienterochelin and colicins